MCFGSDSRRSFAISWIKIDQNQIPLFFYFLILCHSIQSIIIKPKYSQMQHSILRKHNLDTCHQNISFRRSKEDLKKQITNPSTLMSSNQSGVSNQEVHGTIQNKLELSLYHSQNSGSLNEKWNDYSSNKKTRKTDVSNLCDSSVVPSGALSQRFIEAKDIKPRNLESVYEVRRRSVSCNSKQRQISAYALSYKLGNPSYQIKKIRDQRLKKNRQLEQLQQRITLLGKRPSKKQSIRLKQENTQLRKRLSQYSYAVQQFSSFIDCPKLQNPSMSRMKEKWHKIIKNISN